MLLTLTTSSYEGTYPYRPTLIALQKTMEFLKIAEATNSQVVGSPKNPEREKQLMDEQKALVKKIITDSYQTYHDMRERLVRGGGVNASFKDLECQF